MAAMRQLSEERLARYREVVEPISALDELVPAMADLWKEDEAAGHVRVVAQVIAGSANRAELAGQIVDQMEPWVELAHETLERVLPPGLPAGDLAYGIVVWYVGANLMAHLEPGGQAHRRALRAGTRVDAAPRGSAAAGAITSAAMRSVSPWRLLTLGLVLLGAAPGLATQSWDSSVACGPPTGADTPRCFTPDGDALQ